MLSLRALKHFSTLAEERHYSRAAAKLHLTQSALTRSIQSLEETLGLKLLDRSAAGIRLTKPGRSVLAHAHRVLAEAAALKRETELIRGLASGEVAMGAGVFPAAGFLSPLLTQLAQDYPGISMRVEIEGWASLVEMLAQDRLDFVVAVTHSLPPSAEFTVRPLPPQHAGLFVRAGHPLLAIQGRSALRSALMNYRLAATPLPPRTRDHLAALYRLTSVDDLPMALECNSVAALRAVALGSDVIFLCMRESIRGELEDGSLIQLPIFYSNQTELTCSIIHHAGRTLSPAAVQVISMVEALMSEGAAVKK
ncbi:LysR family transcriptional regulator [Allopusillimonas ginsengisoli]|uniref:LysR family transcriptional regulator n=1 Tax=Allopusillimonas ginsengisoli TaxID=453575 RepID=UPI001FD6D591|nr:LysR family transcriptional regulator [Allopusillimonas ginsengisoli]